MVAPRKEKKKEKIFFLKKNPAFEKPKKSLKWGKSHLPKDGKVFGFPSCPLKPVKGHGKRNNPFFDRLLKKRGKAASNWPVKRKEVN